MNVLILHNDNLPDDILNLNNHSDNDLIVSVEKIAQPSDSEEVFDTFITTFLTEYLDNYSPDLIILPYSLSSYNPLELTGLQCALHIRLDNHLDKYSRKPVLFLGPNSLEELLKISRLGAFISTTKVFTSTINTSELLINWILNNQTLLTPLTDSEYSRFVDSIIVPPPLNYKDAHHSITNLWTIIRWIEMFEWEDSIPLFDKTVEDFTYSLYFKWLHKKIGDREHFKRKKKENRIIPHISGKTIVHIDDEISRGWGNILSNIITYSGANYIAFKDFNTTDTRDGLISKLIKFIDNQSDVDCYILDLRLHEEDHIDLDYNKYTGHQIARHIYNKNHGNQIVLFTASEKIWNYIESEKYITGYAIKENPLNLLSTNDSRELFNSFSHSIQSACNNSFLREIFNICTGKSYLEDFFEILRKDDISQRQNHIINMRSAALNLNVFIESFIKEQFEIDGLHLRFKDNNSIAANVSDVYIESQTDTMTGRLIPKQMELFKDLTPTNRNWKRVTSHNDLSLICATLSKYYRISSSQVNKVIHLRNIRNRSIAHGNGPSVIDKSFLIDIFNNVVRILLANNNATN